MNRPLAYVPFLLTGDPYYLEEMQFAATYNVLASNGAARRSSFCIGFALRAHAWALRALAECATRARPTMRQAGCSRAPIGKNGSTAERDWMLGRYVNPTAAPFNVLPYCHFISCSVHRRMRRPAARCRRVPCRCNGWRITKRRCWATLCRSGTLTGCRYIEWKLVNTLARTNGTSGWARAKPAPYNVALRPDADAAYVQGWQGCWDLNVQMQPAIAEFDDPDVMPAGDSLTYASYAMSALALAATLGVEGAAEAHAWLRGQIENNSDDNTYIDRKWSMS